MISEQHIKRWKRITWVILIASIWLVLGHMLVSRAASAPLQPQMELAIRSSAPRTHRRAPLTDTNAISTPLILLPLVLRNYALPVFSDWQPALASSGHLAFARRVNSLATDIFLLDPDSVHALNLTQTPDADEETPVFAPDGRVIFASNRGGQWDIYAISVKQTSTFIAPLVAAPDSDEVHPSVSPDGKTLAFSSNAEGGNWDLYTRPVTGGTWTRQTQSPETERFPVFADGGRALIYRREIAGNSDIYRLDLDDGTIRRLTEYAGFDGYPSATPDGSGVVFVSDRSGDLMVHDINAAGAGERLLTLQSPFEDARYVANTPRLAPDGHDLVYAAAPKNGELGNVYSIFVITYTSPLNAVAEHGITQTTGVCDWLYGWPAGVLALGWGTAWRETGDEIYAQYIQDWLDSCDLESYVITQTNDGLLGHAALMAYQYDPQPEYLDVAQRVADFFMDTAPRTEDGTLAHFGDDVWVDSLLGSVPFFVEMARVSGDSAYLDEAVRQVIGHAEVLQDSETGLYRHAWRESTGEYLSTSYWGRGNGWAMMSSARLLSALPLTHTARAQILALAQKQAQGLAALQDDSGLWHTVVNRPDFYLETTGTAGIAYGLCEGLQEGWLSEDLYSTAQAARFGLWKRVLANGKLTLASDSTIPMSEEGYNNLPYGATELYGQGLALMALGTCAK